MTTGTPRTAPRRAPKATTTAATALLLLLAGCSDDGGSAATGSTASAPVEPTPPVVSPTPSPAPDPDPTPVPDPTPEPAPSPDDARFAGAAFTSDYWPVPSRNAPLAPEGLGPLTVTATTTAYRLTCIESERRITGVDVGPDAAARRIATTLEDAAASAHTGWRSWFASEDDCRLDSGETISLHGETEQILLEEPCALPDGPPLRCFLLIDRGYPAGAAHTYLGLDQLVFDATTGAPLTLTEILAPTGLAVAAAQDRVNEVIAHLDGSSRDVELLRARPTADGLVIPFAPYEAGPYSDGTRQLFVPWDVLGAPGA